MAAQEVREVPKAQAEMLLASGRRIGPDTFAIPSRGVTVTVRQGSAPGKVKLIITSGCDC